MKLILFISCLCSMSALATELDDSVWNGSSSDTQKSSTFTNDSSLFVGASVRFKDEGRLPASAIDEMKESQSLDDGIWDGTSVK